MSTIETPLTQSELRGRVAAHLVMLADAIGPRPPGSPANRRATDYVNKVLTAAGLQVDAAPFTTSWWEPGVGTLEVADGSSVDVAPNPYSPPGTVGGEVVRLEGWDEITTEGPSLTGRVIVLGPVLGGEPVMPKAFPFFSSEEGSRLTSFLKRHKPAAVIALSERHASMPTFEDPDLGIPSITVSPNTGTMFQTGDEIRLTLGGRTRQGNGVNLSARIGEPGLRIAVSAHIDAKATTPGAFDNAASVATVLALAESGCDLRGPTEFVFFNGEDHYDACGEQAWLEATDLGDIKLNVNLDGAGVAGRKTGVASFGCPPALDAQIDRIAELPGWAHMEPWWESDHAIFAMRGIPAVAITSEGVHDLFTTVAHTGRDTLKVVDIDILVGIVEQLGVLISEAHTALAR